MRPRTQKQPQVKKELCRVLDDVDVDVDVAEQTDQPASLYLYSSFYFIFGLE